MLHPFLKFLVPPLICIGKSCLRWSNFTFIDSPACCLFVCHVFVSLFVFFCFFFRESFFCCFLIVRRFCFSEGRKHDSGVVADFGLLHYLQLHATSPWGRPMWKLGIWHILQGCNFKGHRKMLFWYQRCKHLTPLWVKLDLLRSGFSGTQQTI